MTSKDNSECAIIPVKCVRNVQTKSAMQSSFIGAKSSVIFSREFSCTPRGSWWTCNLTTARSLGSERTKIYYSDSIVTEAVRNLWLKPESTDRLIKWFAIYVTLFWHQVTLSIVYEMHLRRSRFISLYKIYFAQTTRAKIIVLNNKYYTFLNECMVSVS